MNVIDLIKFGEINKANKLFCFSTPYCGLCKQQKNEMTVFSDCIFVETIDEDGLMLLDIDAVPCTILYDNDCKIVFKKYGILYDVQKKELKEIYDKIHNSTKSTR